MRKAVLIIFGLFLAALILEAALRLAGFSYLAWQDYQNSRVLKKLDKVEYRILCLGESTTAFGGENSYPRQLERILNEKIKSAKFVVINKGLPGVDTSLIISQLEHYLNSYRPDMVIAMMGINDDDFGGYLSLNSRFLRLKALINESRVYKLFKVLRARLSSKDVLKKMYLAQAERWLEVKRYPEARQMFEEVLKADSQSDEAYVGLAKCYYEQGMNVHAEEALELALKMPLKSKYLYVDIGWCYCDMGRQKKAEEMFKKAIALRPLDYDLYIELAKFYHDVELYAQAQEMYLKALDLAGIERRDSWPYSAFGWHYLERNMYRQAEEMFKKAIEADPHDFSIYRDWGLLKQAQGQYIQAREYFDRAKHFMEESRSKTSKNYQRLKDLVLKRGVKLVCVQYPLRNLEDLKRMFDSGRMLYLWIMI